MGRQYTNYALRNVYIRVTVMRQQTFSHKTHQVTSTCTGRGTTFHVFRLSQTDAPSKYEDVLCKTLPWLVSTVVANDVNWTRIKHPEHMEHWVWFRPSIQNYQCLWRLSPWGQRHRLSVLKPLKVQQLLVQWSLYIPPSTFRNSTFCPHTVFMCFVWISEQTAIISLYSINWLVCITET